MLLDVDRMYRERAAEGRLRTIAQRRFNPAGRAWLPIMHAAHGAWHFTALHSNSRQSRGDADAWAAGGQRVVRGRENDGEATEG